MFDIIYDNYIMPMRMKYNSIASQKSVNDTVSALQAKGIDVHAVETESEALEIIKQTIPKGASVMHGSSTTLQQIGYMQYLETGTHGWNDLHTVITKENDPAKRAALRNQSVSSDYYLGSVHALTEQGEFLIASNTGSQLPHIAFTSPNLIFVVGTQKIVPSLMDGMRRLEEYVMPLENVRSTKAYGVNSAINKILIVKGENQILKRRIHFVLVNKPLGY